MRHQWLEEDLTCDRLSQELGCKVKNIISGQVVIGEQDGQDARGNSIKIPITKPGIEIEFEREPTAEQVSKLDGIFSLQKLKREGGRDLVAEITALAQRVKLLEDKVK